MTNTYPGTDIQIGKWYPATQIPPNLFSGDDENEYCMILGIKSIGPIPGYYIHGSYHWHCERYDLTDDCNEAETDAERSQEINECLQWTEQPAMGVTSWMIIPIPDDNLDPIDNLSGFGQDLSKSKDAQEESGEPKPGSWGNPIPVNIIKLHLN